MKYTNRASALAMGVALPIFVMASAPAFAQDAAATDTARANENSVSDIVVTARRRAESSLDVPIAVTALAGDSLARRGIERVDDLQRSAPSVSFRPTAGRRSNSQYELRGISSTESLITGDAAVGIYVDEVYRARATGTNQSFYDIDNVQVLYGPQGTLFGRNSSAGAVLINTKRPTDIFEGQINAGIGNLDRRELTAVLNVPLGDKLAVRVAGQRVKREGYGVNVTTGRRLADINSWSGRGSIVFRPTETIENTSIFSYYHANEKGSLVFLNGYRPCPSATATAPAASCSRASMPDVPVVDTRTIGQAVAEAWAARQTLSPWQTALDASLVDFSGTDRSITSVPGSTQDPFERSRNFSATNITTFELSDSLTLKNVFGYNHVSLKADNDLDGTPIKLVNTYYETATRQFSNELQLQGENGGLTWVVGGLYFREKGNDLQNAIQNVYSDSRTNLVGINKSYAVFAQGTYKLTDKLSVTAGGRYTWDKRFARYIQPTVYSLAQNTLVRGVGNCSLSPALDTDRDCILEQRASFKQPTYTVSLDYKPSRNLLFYVAHRLGYRSGGLQARTGLVATGPAVGGITPVGNTPPFTQEKVRDVELGFKGDIDLGGEVRLGTTLAAYKAWYTGVQRQITLVTGLSSTTNPVGTVTTTGVFNVGDAQVKGLSAELSLTLVRGFNLSGFYGYVDGEYTKFRTATAVLSGIPFATSKHTAGVTAALTPIDNEETGRVTFTGTYSYRSSFTTDQSLPNIEPESTAGPQHQVNLTLNWESVMGSGFSGQLWVRNATNEANPLGFTALAGSFGVTPGVMGEPRTYGLNLGYKF